RTASAAIRHMTWPIVKCGCGRVDTWRPPGRSRTTGSAARVFFQEILARRGTQIQDPTRDESMDWNGKVRHHPGRGPPDRAGLDSIGGSDRVAGRPDRDRITAARVSHVLFPEEERAG